MQKKEVSFVFPFLDGCLPEAVFSHEYNPFSFSLDSVRRFLEKHGPMLASIFEHSHDVIAPEPGAENPELYDDVEGVFDYFIHDP